MWNRRAQSTVEYAVLAAVVVGALLAMQIYIKRGAMGKMKSATDSIGEQFTPLHTVSKMTTSLRSNRQNNQFVNGTETSKLLAEDGQDPGNTTESN